MDKNSKDFAEKFYDEASKIEDWNNPPDLIFNNAIAQVNHQKTQKSNRLKSQIALIGLVISIAAIVLFLNYKFSIQDSELTQLKDRIESIGISTENVQVQLEQTIQKSNLSEGSINTATESLNKKSQSVASTIVPQSATQVITLEENTVKSADLYTATSVVTQEVNSDKIINQPSTTSSNVINNNNTANSANYTSTKVVPQLSTIAIADTKDNKVTIDSRVQLAATEALANPGIKVLPTTTLGISALNLNLTPAPLSSLDYRKGLILNAKTLVRRSRINMRGLPEHKDLHLTDYQQFRTNIAFELNLEKELKGNLSVFGGVGYQQLTNLSQSTESLEYSSSNEIQTADGFIYTDNMVLDTPVGFSKQEVSFKSSESLEGKIMEQASATTLNLEIINLRLGLKKRFDFNRFVVAPYGALGSNFIINNQTTFDTSIYSDGEFVTTAQKTSDNLSSTNKHFLTLEVGTDLLYKINDRTTIGLNFGYEQSITSLRQNSTGLKSFTNSFITGVTFSTRL